MAEIIVQGMCNGCSGTGLDNRVPEDDPPITCGSCGGIGWFTKGDKIDTTDIMDALADILDKCNDIKEKVDEL